MTSPVSSAGDGRAFLRFDSYGEHRTLQDVAFTGAMRRLPSAHRNKLANAEPALPGDGAMSGGPTGTFVTLTAAGKEN